MLGKLIHTNSHLAPTVLRLTLGAVFFAHGAQKVLGWWGGHGFSATLNGFEHSGIPAVFALLAIAAEFLGGIGLILGLLGRVAAFGIACVMLVAIAKVHAANGFFMNWTGGQKGEGFEYHLLVLAITVAIMIAGSGAWSVDRALSRSASARP
jgi:putative oxidoreductase